MPHIDLWWITRMLSNFVRIFTSLYMTIVPVDCSTRVKCVSSSLMHKSISKEICFLESWDFCMLSFGPTEACRHAILDFCKIHNEHLSSVSLIVNLLLEQTWEVSSEMPCIFIYSMPAHVVTRLFLFLSDAFSNTLQICKSVLFGLDTRD